MADSPPPAPVTVPACRNCGAAAPGRYCPSCGQETALALPTAGAFLREAAGRYVALDGRFARTLYHLSFKPGFLTREYLAGRRKRYIRPARLFLVLALALFAVLRLASEVLPIRAAAETAIAHADRGDVALVFGTEMSGLSNDQLARCGVVATIPTNPAYGSLNLAAAVQVACYEMRVALTGDRVWQAPRFAPATTDEIAALDAHAERTLVDLRFLNPRLPRRLMPRLRRLFARAGLEKEEVNILRGILARIDETMRR